MAFGDWLHFLTGGITTKKGRGFLFGEDDKLKQLENLSPEQQQILQQLLGNVQGMGGQGAYGQATNLLQQYLDPQSDIYKNFEAPYRQEFEQQTVPMLAERFAGQGAQGGALSSSGFGQALGAAGSNLQTNLAQMKSGLQRQSISDILGQYNTMAGLGLGTQPFSYYNKPGHQGFLPTMATGALKAFGGF
jgi:hypothetical protein